MDQTVREIIYYWVNDILFTRGTLFWAQLPCLVILTINIM